MIDIWQIDFNNLNWHVAGNDLQLFSLVALDNPAETTYRPTFMHASNAAFGGSTADGADNAWRAFYQSGSTLTFDSFLTTEGWDKTSDINVQVFATSVPEPTSLMLLGAGLVGIILRSRKRS